MICPKCGNEHTRFSALREQSYCHACHAAYMRVHRLKHSELSEEARLPLFR